MPCRCTNERSPLSPRRPSPLAGALSAIAIAAAGVLVAATVTAPPAAAATGGTGTGYLHTSGNKIVDSTGATVRLTGINWGARGHAPLTTRSAHPTHDVGGTLLDMTNVGKATAESQEEFVATDRAEGHEKWRATRADLVFGSNAELRAIAEVYGCADGQDKFVKDFVAAWSKVMNLDRFDLK